MEITRPLHNCNSKSGISSEKFNNDSLMKETNESETRSASYRHSPTAFDSACSPRRSGSGDRALVTNYKSEMIDDLENTVDRLKNALVSLEEDNLSLNKKIRENKAEDRPSLANHNVLSSTSSNNSQERPSLINHNVLGSTSGNNSQEMAGDHSPTSKLNTHAVTFNIAKTYPESQRQDTPSKIEETRMREMLKMESLSLEDRCVHLEKEKQDLRRKLRKTEDYCKECVRELKRILPKYEDLKALNKTLDKRNKQQAAENRRLVNALEAESQAGERSRDPSLAREPKEGDGDNRVWVQLERANDRCTQLTQEKGQLEDQMASLAREVSRLTNELDMSWAELHRLGARCRSSLEGSTTRDGSPLASSGNKHLAERILDSVGKERKALSGSVAHLKEENKTLRENLKQSVKRGEEAEGGAKQLRGLQAILESCLLTVQQEKDLLTLEVQQLHQEYIDLSSSISLQLRERSPVTTARILAGSHEVIDDGARQQESPRQPLNSSPITREMLDGPVGGEAIDHIRKRFEEEEQRAQRYKNIINQNE
ncbi:coiled-coil domain-containing protein 110-like [Oncorhynchus nerka]|uniref:coiled-coil domain-containing protein 110-like n=1 Tax=Oncorhynchus nerka TaxID=8023 RepID=UPI0011316F4E|nr:coiled-coil domain-containing protein 110-like [Oncorhynchus nerka]